MYEVANESLPKVPTRQHTSNWELVSTKQRGQSQRVAVWILLRAAQVGNYRGEISFIPREEGSAAA